LATDKITTTIEMEKSHKIIFKILVLGILLVLNQSVFAQSVLITPSKSLDSDTLSIQKKLVVGAKYASKSANRLEVHSNGKVHLSVDGTGKVGVGTSTPQNIFHVEGRTQLNGRLFINTKDGMPDTPNSNLSFGQITAVSESQDSSDIDIVLYEDSGFSPWLNFGKARGTIASPANLQQNDGLFKIVGSAYSNNDFYESGDIELSIDGVPSSTSIPTAMRLRTTREGTIGAQTSISIRSTGFVGIGTDHPQQQLSVQQGMNIDQAALNDGTLFNGLRFGNNSSEGIASRRTGGGDSNFFGLDFFTNNNIRMTLTNGGNVGIGTTNPTQAKLVVNGNVNNALAAYGFLKSDGSTGTNTSGNSQNYSIYASNRIAATEFNAFSDARIKDIKGITNNEKDLETLSRVQITDYQFKDKIGNGNGVYKKVIAQQVEGVYPQAVNKITDCIPDIYQLAKIEKGFVYLSNHHLKAGDRVKLIFGEKQAIVEVKEVANNGFRIHSPSAEELEKAEVFVYGREVSDFRSVDYEALSTLNISATQALLKRLNEAEKRLRALEKEQAKMSQMEARMSAMEKRLDTGSHP
jgi:Chaperone of endosialidase